MIVHSETYRGIKPHNIVHRARLGKLIKLFQSLDLPTLGKWADFGCSDGFILSLIYDLLPEASWELVGFDHSEKLLGKAKERHIPNSRFEEINLNRPADYLKPEFDVVSCLETIEHTGNYRCAFNNLIRATKFNGKVIISIPNEIGFAGILKFLGRKMFRKEPYDNFFNGNRATESEYFRALLFGKNLETFRDAQFENWGPHLGFDYRNFETFVTSKFLIPGSLQLEYKTSAFIGFNRIYVFRKSRS